MSQVTFPNVSSDNFFFTCDKIYHLYLKLKVLQFISIKKGA